MKRILSIMLLLSGFAVFAYGTLFETNIADQNVTYVGGSRVYSCDESKAKENFAGSWFYKDFQIYWEDVSDGLTEKHCALGFYDIALTVVISNASWDTNTGGDYVERNWKMYGDEDYRNDRDLRAYSDGILYEMIDTRYKSVQYYDTRFCDGASSWEFTVIRFAAPKRYTGKEYKIFLGQSVLRPDPEDEGAGVFYQVRLYTPEITNKVIPVVAIESPEYDGSFTSTYRYDRDVRSLPIRTYNVVEDTAVAFTGTNTYNESGLAITSYAWDMGDGTTYTGENVEHVYTESGEYDIQLTVTTSDGLSYVNNGSVSPSDAGLEYAPAALPFTVSVVANGPESDELTTARPSPFLPGVDSEMVVDFKLASASDVEVKIVNMFGEVVRVLKQGAYQAGYWSARWDGKTSENTYVGDGIYFAVLTTTRGVYTKKLRVIR